MRIKICGITRSGDVRAAAEAGADAIGLNFVSGPRKISVEQAEAILEEIPSGVTSVALVRPDDGELPEDLLDFLAGHRVNHLQLYGATSQDVREKLRSRNMSQLHVIPVRGKDFAREVRPLIEDSGPPPDGIVLDTYDKMLEGGTGKAFHWDWVAAAREGGELDGWPGIILAGGLRPENVADAIRVVQPMAVDVSSGVEVEGKAGYKDPQRMHAFVQESRRAFEAMPQTSPQ